MRSHLRVFQRNAVRKTPDEFIYPQYMYLVAEGIVITFYKAYPVNNQVGGLPALFILVH